MSKLMLAYHFKDEGIHLRGDWTIVHFIEEDFIRGNQYFWGRIEKSSGPSEVGDKNSFYKPKFKEISEEESDKYINNQKYLP